MAKKAKLTWFELEPTMFPQNVQDAVARVHKANAALSALIKASKEAKEKDAAIEAADALIAPFAARLEVPVMVPVKGDDGEMVLRPDLTQPKVLLIEPGKALEISYNYEKLTVASKAKAKGKSSLVSFA